MIMRNSGRGNVRVAWSGMKLAAQIAGLYCLSILILSWLLSMRADPSGLGSMPFLALPHPGHCAFCGMTHSFLALSRGDLIAARDFNPAGPVLYLAFAALGIAAVALSVVRYWSWLRSLRTNPLKEDS